MSAKRSIALVIACSDPSLSTAESPLWLLVQRPPDDADLPNVWGLPAGSFRAGEAEGDLVARIGRDKLGVELAIGPVLGEGAAERRDGQLSMRVFLARVVAGRPRVAQRADDVTQYSDWAWGRPNELEPGARRGSLCCKIALATTVGSRSGEVEPLSVEND